SYRVVVNQLRNVVTKAYAAFGRRIVRNFRVRMQCNSATRVDIRKESAARITSELIAETFYGEAAFRSTLRTHAPAFHFVIAVIASVAFSWRTVERSSLLTR